MANGDNEKQKGEQGVTQSPGSQDCFQAGNHELTLTVDLVEV